MGNKIKKNNRDDSKMKTIIYPDSQTDLKKYEKLNTTDLKIYNKNVQINDTQITKDETDQTLLEADVIILTQSCINTGKYNLENIKQACEQIREFVDENKTIVFDTPLPPRSVYKMSKVIDDLGIIKDMNLAYITHIDDDTQLIGYSNENTKNLITDLYKDMALKTETTNNIQTAECVPIIQNAYKDTLIALPNQTAILSEAITIDLIEAIKLANMNKDINLLNPQPVLHNDIIRDSQEIVNLADEYGEAAQLSQTTRDTNNYVAYHVAYMAEKELYLKEHLAMFETTVAILGITEDLKLITEDNNVSLILIDDFVSRDVDVLVCDDKIPEEIIQKHGAKKITLDEAYDADCIIIMTDDPQFKNLEHDKVQIVVISALPILNKDEFDDKEYSSVGQYRLKKEEML